MKKIVLDTNCLLMIIPKSSPYRNVWNAFLEGKLILCISNEIVEEYLEILSNKTTFSIASNVISTILNQRNVELIKPYYRFGLIQADADDNKFVDCAIAAGAEFLVSNDSHFTVLEQIPFPKANVLHLKSFSNMIRGYEWKENVTLLNEPSIRYGSNLE